MRKNFKSKSKKFLAAFLALSLIFTMCIGDSAWAYITDFASTHIFFNEEREIGKGVVLNNWQGRNPDGTPKLGHTITFNAKTSDAMVVSAFGNSVKSRETLSSTSYLIEQQGVSVLGGINGDFYHLANGVPIGIAIQDGRIVSNSATEWNAIGFKGDGSVVIGNPRVTMKAIVNGTEYPFGNFNKAQGEWGPYLYSEDFGTTTGSTVSSIEVILNIDSGEPAVGEAMAATIAEIRTNTKATPIGENQLVLSAQLNKTGHWALSQFKVGDIVAFQFTDTTGQWSNVEQAIGGEKLLINKGSVMSGLATKNYNPSTAIGVKANGEVVLYQCDGRTDSSQGVSSYELAQFLYNLGCVQAIQLDGGGSSAMIARMPGHKSPGIVNTPSDGVERANSNAIILVSKQSVAIKNGTAQAGTIAQKVHLYPGKIYALQNATVEYKALATDDYFIPTALPESLVWGSDAGVIDQSGKLTINKGPGNYKVLAGGGKALGNAEITVLNSIAALKPSKTKVTVSPGGSVDLSCTAYYQDTKVYANDSSFKWSVEGNIGSITQEGIFTGAQTPGTGRIVVSYGNVKATIDVVFADIPDSVEDFENGALWGSSIVRAKSGTASIVQDASLAQSGTKLLKVDYDFTLADGAEKGVAGAYAYKLDANTKLPTSITLEKDPNAIGMWIYGDNSKTWLRARVKDGKGQSFDIDFTKDYRTDTKTGGVNWTGWKYVEAAIPEGKVGPFALETPIRIMCTRDEMRGKGTIYFDKITAVYGASSKDAIAPTAKIVSPANSAIFNTGKVPINIELTDNTGGSGINASSVKVHLDGVEVPGLTVSTNGVIIIKGELGTNNTLSDGLHKLVVNFSDAAGNTGSNTVTFAVETGAPQITVSSSPTYDAGGGTFTTDISVKNPKNLRKFYLVFTYDPNQVEFVDADGQTPGKQAAFESWVKKGTIMNNQVNETGGKIILSVDNLANLSSGTLSKIGTMTFKAKSNLRTSTNINYDFGAMLVANNSASLRFSLPSMTVNMGYGLSLAVIGTSKGDPTTFTVTDKNGNPVAGANLYVDQIAKAVWTTDSTGKVNSSDITQLPVGASFTVMANKNGIISNTITFTVTDKTTGLTPQKVSLSLTPDPGGLAINYVTPLDQAGTWIQYAEKSSFTGAFSFEQKTGADSAVSLVNLTETKPVRVHTAILSSLKAGTDYVYRFTDNTGNTSPVYEFTTPDYRDSYSFVFLTDPQAANEEAYKVFGDVLSRAVQKAGNPAFAMLGGDLADRGGNLKQWELFFNSGAQIFSKLPIMVAAGNHEAYDDAALTNFKAFFNLPINGPAGFEETAYSFQTDDALFMVMDTQKNLTSQLQWLEETSRSSSKRWKIVMMHRGIYSGFYDEAELRKVIAPAFDRAGIDLVLNGHDHTYLRTTMKSGNKVPLGQGTTYITGGSSGKKYYDAVARTWTEVLYEPNNPVFTTFRVYSDRISVVSSHVENGKTVDHDQFEIAK